MGPVGANPLHPIKDTQGAIYCAEMGAWCSTSKHLVGYNSLTLILRGFSPIPL
ncbi:hypothetical protein [Desulfitobacterium sp. LBE]|uniref:hypothetical protein n=1 Tax=Desulfitobacterium sp. LBE TaxID=884086 RepID=UPI00155AA46B|nr:hypothetical protein [Desulfitobacterium sp. LBE]